jgi:hypothetical protein
LVRRFQLAVEIVERGNPDGDEMRRSAGAGAWATCAG